MTAPVRQQGIRIDPLAVFVARSEARATLWAVGELSLHVAVDELWHAAVRDGLVAKLGADKVQQLLADVFAPVRDDLAVTNVTAERAEPTEDDSSAVTNVTGTDDEYDGLPSSFAKACRRADEKQRRKPPDPHLEKLRRLLDDDVSIESAWHQLSKPLGVPIATLWAAEYLVQQGDAERFRRWLDQHSADERACIRRHLEAKRCRSHKSK
jgi:hypothetical protein